MRAAERMEEAKVSDIAAGIPHATALFERLRIDYCCGGGRTLREACTAAGVNLQEVVAELAQRPGEQAAEARDWSREPPEQLVSHIVSTHHAFVRRELPRLAALLEEVCRAHADRRPELQRVRALFGSLRAELEMHLAREEGILFPFVRQLAQARRAGQAAPSPPFATAANPIRVMEAEHDRAGAALREIRRMSGDYQPPADACASYQALYQGLHAFERDLHQHIHLENNILFPRTLELEAGRLSRG